MGDKTLSNYIVDPKKDGVDAEFIEVEGKAVPEAEEKKDNAVIAGSDEKEIKETKEDKAERYKGILTELGFSMKTGEDGKIQYTRRDGGLSVGRTFTARNPTGKFWAREEDGTFLNMPEVKKMEIVQAFYDIREGKIGIETVKQSVKPKQEEGLVSQKSIKPTKNKNAEPITRVIGEMPLTKKGGYYPVAGHNEPDAALVQQWANELGVSLKILSAEQDEIRSKAVIRAALNNQTVDAAVIHHFDTSRDVIALEVIESMQRKRMNPIESYREDGRPLLSQETNYRIYKRYIRFKNFSLRDAVTKACRIASLKILNKEWRDQEEIESEAAEVNSINRE
jgi:uncharacterized protein YqeY